MSAATAHWCLRRLPGCRASCSISGSARYWGQPLDGTAMQGDVGFFGPDKGKGGKFLILPPGYDKPVPEGYFVYRSATNNVFVFLRSFYQDPNDLKPAVAVMEATKIYLLGAE